ncbi:MAG: C25 family cysteine peptidase [Bacteroidales bacterium]|nr:C25 family cysteine peptidase [Bacteroidales bacterium]
MKYFRLFIATLTCILASVVKVDAQCLTINEQNAQKVSLEYKMDKFDLKPIEVKGESMCEVTMSGLVMPNLKGEPNVPFINRMMAIPQGATAKVSIVSFDKEIIGNVDIAPSLGYCVENDDLPTDYEKNISIYSKDATYPGEIVKIAGKTELRGVDVVQFSICPVQFNPVKKEIAVYRNIVFSIEFEGGNGHFGEDRLRSPYWDPILSQNVINYDCLPKIDYEKRMQQWLRDNEEGAEYLIMVPNNEDFRVYGEKLANYRRKQGILTQVLSMNDIGVSNIVELRAWFHEAYASWAIPPVAVCLLGDHNTNINQGIPAMISDHPSDGTCITDNFYADVNDDNLPDMCFSRLVAKNKNELPVFVDRQIEYEYTNPNMEPYTYSHPITALGWDVNKWFQISLESVGGFLRQQGKTPARFSGFYNGDASGPWSMANNTDYMLNYFGPNGLGYIPATPQEMEPFGGFGDDEGFDVLDAINQGTSVVQHRDHGWTYTWFQPELLPDHLAELHNVGKLPFLISVNCKTGDFNAEGSCLAEAFLRSTYEGHNTGVVGAIAPTGQSFTFNSDVFMLGIWDYFYPNFLPDIGYDSQFEGSSLPAFANVSSKYMMMPDFFPNLTVDSRKYTQRMYHSHCDAFLQVFMGLPQNMDLTYDQAILAGTAEFQITAPLDTHIGLSKKDLNGNIIILGVGEGTGAPQIIEMSDYLLTGDSLLVTVTGKNYLRQEIKIQVIPSNEAFVTLSNYAINDGNMSMCYDSEAEIDIELKNVGLIPSENGSMTLSTDSDYVTIETPTITIPALESEQAYAIENAFHINIADNVPNNTQVHFLLQVECDGNIYESHFSAKIGAPNCNINFIRITNTTGHTVYSLDPGEFYKMEFTIKNNGACSSGHSILRFDGGDNIRSVTDPIVFDDLGPGESLTATFDVYVEWDAGAYFNVPFTLYLDSGEYDASQEYTTFIGTFVEPFETNPSTAIWSYQCQDYTAKWKRDNVFPYEGHFCMKSGWIANHTTSIILTYTTARPGNISFYYRVASHPNYGFLKFFIDDNEMGSWSGSIPWTEASFSVSPGTHRFKWAYTKSQNAAGGQDCAWIDYVSLPPTYDNTLENEMSNIAVYPNPTKGLLRISSATDDPVDMIYVYDLMGRIVMSKAASDSIDLTELAEGLYVVKVEINGSFTYHKVMVGK